LAASVQSAKGLKIDYQKKVSFVHHGRIMPPVHFREGQTLQMTSEIGNLTGLGEVRALVKQLDEKLAHLDPRGVAHGAVSAAAPLPDMASDQRLEQLAEFAAGIVSAIDLDKVIDRTLQMLLKMAGAERAFLSVRESDKSVIERLRSANKGDGNAWAAEKIAKASVDRVRDNDEELMLVDVRTDPQLGDDADAYEVDLGPLVCLPMRDGSVLVGALYLDRRTGAAPFGAGEMKIVHAIASIATRAIVNAKMTAEQFARRQHLEMLNKLYSAISRTLELDQLLDQITQITLEVTGAERAFILLMSAGQLRFGGGRDQGGPLPAQASRELSRSVCQKVLKTQEGVYVFDTQSDAEFSAKLSVVNLKLNSVVAVPLKGQQGLSGLLYIDSKTQSLTTLEKELAILSNIANVASMAVDNARLYRQATQDGLTGLYVRSFFMVRMEEEAMRSGRFGRVFSLLVMDIDHFKKFNDSYGHQTGDEVIKIVSQVIKRAIRLGVDIPGRYGGEEMVCMLPETNLEGAMVVAERIRTNIENSPLSGPNGDPLKVTISIGVATFPAMGETGTQLFEKADQALYTSKQTGRNRTTAYQPPK
jgi:diguanylate cyclase (GGDEF)-like protein